MRDSSRIRKMKAHACPECSPSWVLWTYHHRRPWKSWHPTHEYWPEYPTCTLPIFDANGQRYFLSFLDRIGDLDRNRLFKSRNSLLTITSRTDELPIEIDFEIIIDTGKCQIRTSLGQVIFRTYQAQPSTAPNPCESQCLPIAIDFQSDRSVSGRCQFWVRPSSRGSGRKLQPSAGMARSRSSKSLFNR